VFKDAFKYLVTTWKLHARRRGIRKKAAENGGTARRAAEFETRLRTYPASVRRKCRNMSEGKSAPTPEILLKLKRFPDALLIGF